jgi:ribosomal-protein-alanine N-acetyltransferase
VDVDGRHAVNLERPQAAGRRSTTVAEALARLAGRDDRWVTDEAGGVVVEVRPAQADELRALIEGDAAFEARFGRRVEPGFSSFDGVLEHSLEAITTGGAAPEWSTHLFYAGPEDGAVLIGIGGFKGPPVDGVVEIGYEIAPALRGRGRAGAAAAALVDTARRHGCTTVIAHTLAETNPSTSVLARLGFARTEAVEDPDEGSIWRWELSLS